MSTVDQHDHHSVEQLSDYVEGLITDPSALTTMDAHLAGCLECQQVLRELRDVAALLQAEPVGPMPAMVAVRLEAALSAAAHERRLDQAPAEPPATLRAASAGLTPDTAEMTPAGRSPETDDMTSAGRSPNTEQMAPVGRSPETEVMAAARTGSELGEAAAAGKPPSGAPRSLSDARRRRARTVSALAAAATVAAFAIGAAIFSQNMSATDNSTSGEAAVGRKEARDSATHGYTGPTPATGGAYVTASDQEFTAYTLSATAQGLLSERTLQEASPRAAAQTPTDDGLASAPSAPMAEGPYLSSAGLSTLLSPTRLAACVAQLVPDPAGVQVLAIDVGRYDEAPAVLFILSDPADPAKAQVRVVGEQCGQGQAAELLRTEIRRS